MRVALVFLCVLPMLTSEIGICARAWDDLRVTWTQDPRDPRRFARLPLTENRAKAEGYTRISGCGESPRFLGSRYVKDEDYTVITIYDSNGNIAGIQSGIPQATNGYPFANIQPPFIKDGDLYFITAYFVHPGTVCRMSRSRRLVRKQGIGTNLYLQTKDNPARIDSFTLIPKEESVIRTTPWTGGMCLPTMGVHYWYNLTVDMSCEDLFPMFLLYNSGKLNAFGWGWIGNLTSSRLETPRKQFFPLFANPVPNCLLEEPEVRTMHIYLTRNPEDNYC